MARFIALALALLFTGTACYEGLALYRSAATQRLLADLAQIKINDQTAPALVFAKAYDLAQHGDKQEAARLYGTLLYQDDAQLRAKTRYNLGTLYLEEAAKLWHAKGVLEYARVATWVSAAKEHLREALRLDPENWDARYNLEYAHRITPPPKELDKSDFKASKGSVYATIPSLPGGGP